MVPDVLKRSAFNILTMGPERIMRRRALCLKDLLSGANQLQQAEDELHSRMDPGTAKVLQGKGLLLLESVLQDVGHPDVSLVQEVTRGFPLTGNAAESQVFPKRLRPATRTPTSLRRRGAWARPLIASRAISCGDADVDRTVWSQTREEVAAGWLDGPCTSTQLYKRFGKGWIASRRFGLKQGNKTRLIDNGRESELNSAFTTFEKLDLQDVDDLVCAFDCLMKCVSTKGAVRFTLADGEVLSGQVHDQWGPVGSTKLYGRTLDLKAAYKQVATAFDNRWSAVVVAFCPLTNQPAYFISIALLFGSTAAVHAFNRLSKTLWHSMCAVLDLMCTC